MVCKQLERLIKDHLVDFLVKNNLINPSQHGFLKARSCLTNILCFLEDVTKWVDEGSPVDIIYLDLKKAFDKVPHQRLLLKLKAHCIVLSSQKEFIDNVRICEPLGCSDHNQIYFIIKVKGVQNRKIRYRKNFHKGRYKDMRTYLAKIDWNNTLENKTAKECWNILKSEIDCKSSF